MSTSHAKQAEAYLQNDAVATRHDATFYGVRQKRDKMAQALPEWEQLRDAASQIKKHTVTHLADYLEQFAARAEANGVHVHWAKDADEYNAIVLDILSSHGVKKVVKSKSMLTEECHLNQHLEAQGIDVVETDLGERILQLMHLAPSHIVMPALHVHREEIGDCFRRLGLMDEVKDVPVPEDPNDPTYLTYVARMHLRRQFAEAGAGMTGANFGVAETGDVVVCTNEGNADMSTSIPRLHIVSMGIEKLVPDLSSLAVFQRLLARCGTGQETTVYTSHFRGPRPGGEMHIVLVDNGRSTILADPEHWQTLKCMRCGACMNTCPVYRRSAGYSYSYFIPGPIGINLGMLRDAAAHSGNVSACSLCMSCDQVCPVQVDLSQQIYRWRQRLEAIGQANAMKKLMSQGMTILFNHPALYTATLRLSPAANWLPSALMNSALNPWARGHQMMKFPKKSFHALWNELSKKS
ncbi:MAG: lactate utilization protein [Bacteroidaceae bacterium]|nr:lactate utilization protein [Bacteroidaceae bacterium]MBQ7987912.1 lactate utilization protein [Bacteroidaceae bacterium]